MNSKQITRPTDEQIQLWVARHSLTQGISSSGTDARCAFEDAQSLHLLFDQAKSSQPTAQPSAEAMPEFKECRHCGFECRQNASESKKWYPIEQSATPPTVDHGMQGDKSWLFGPEHKSMRVDYRGLFKAAIAGLRGDGGTAEMMRQLCDHMTELGQRWYAGDVAVVDEILQLYCVERETRRALLAEVRSNGDQWQEDENNFCRRCGKRNGAGIHTCTPPSDKCGVQDDWAVKDAKKGRLERIGFAIERACTHLPADWQLRIELEKDAGIVELYDAGGEFFQIDRRGDEFADEINQNIDAAIAASKSGEQS